ncbi:MAG TPA: alanine racemase, partial [Solirubrobacteraceae bacterium]|nr:alanine racemase [Solirubrobacteraceae bacterium]
VNVDGDPAKGGCPADQALDLVRAVRERSNLSVEGFMTIPALATSANPDAARAGFRRLRALRDDARDRWPEVAHLSMGMSADFEVAVEEGATLVRLGTVVVGSRPRRAYGAASGQEDG